MNYLLSILLLIISGAASAEVLKPFIPEEPDLKGFWWPVYIDASGSKQESFYGLTLGRSPTAEDGTLLDEIKTVIYARALYKPRLPTLASLEELIEDEQKQFKERTPGVEIKATEPVKTLDGRELRSYTFFPKEKGNWERITYREEGDFYLIFTIRSQSQERYEQDLESYFNYIRKYSTPLTNAAKQISAQYDALKKRGIQQRSRYNEPPPAAEQEELRLN